MATIFIAGTLFTIWFVRPCAMNPPPRIATLIGLPCSARASKALSTMIMNNTPGYVILNRHTAPELWLDVIQQLELLVLVRNHCDRQWPLKAEARIVVHEAALILRRIEPADLIARLRVVTQRLITVRKTVWYIESAPALLVQLDGNVLQVSRAFRTEIYDDVENRAACATHQF